MARLRIGDKAPEFSLPSLERENVCLADYENVPLILILLRDRN